VQSNEYGSTLAEAIVATFVVLSLLAALGSAFYLSYAKLAVRDIGYRALLCAAKANELASCKAEAHTKVRKRLPFGKLEKLDLKRRGLGQRVDLIFAFSGQLKFRYKNKFHYGNGR